MNESKTLTKRGELLKSVSETLQDMMEKKARAIPRSLNKIRFIQNSLTVLSDTKDIERMEPRSIARCLLQGAFLDLDFFMGECYAIPYGNQLRFQTDYKGEIKVCKTYCPRRIQDIYAKVVKEGDELNIEVREGKQIANFKPLNFNDGQVLGAFAVCLFEDGGMICDTMSLKEIEKTRLIFSKAPDSKAWKHTPQEMYKKTVIRRLCKVIELKFESEEQDRAFEEGADLDKSKIKDTIDVEVGDPFKEGEKESHDQTAGEKGGDPSSSDDMPSEEEQKKIWDGED